MAEPFLAEIKIVPYNFPPRGWAFCDGQLLAISQNEALFALLGTTYGGDGRSTFALPDLRGRAPVHVGDGLSLGDRDGVEHVSLTVDQLPAHNHLHGSASEASDGSPNAYVLASRPPGGPSVFTSRGEPVELNGSTSEGGGQAHENLQPFLTLSFVIALQGLFPPRA
jgi:microcystin-dependent protein